MKHRSNTLYCFSPPVMLATFSIEVLFAIYIIWRYKLHTLSRLIVSMLFCLAAFQGAEYMICGGLGVQPGLSSKIGYSAISLLPPLGIHLALTIAGKKQPLLLATAYTSAAVFVGYFAFMTGSITGQTCYANYVVFSQPNQIMGWLYALYYYGWLAVGVAVSLFYGSKLKRKRKPLHWLAIGYSAFLIPTTTVNIIDPSTISAIPSIMCGFAVILAFVLTLKVVPSVPTQEPITSGIFRLFSRS